MQSARRWGKRLLALSPAPLALLLLRLCAAHPARVEALFSRTLYPRWAAALSGLSAAFPYALAEKLALGAALLVLALGIFRVGQCFARRSGAPAARFLYRLLCGASAMAAAFTLLWGFHFARLPFAEAARFPAPEEDSGELAALCDALLDDALALRAQAAEDEGGCYAVAEPLPELLARVPEAYDALAESYPFIAGRYAAPKLLSYGEAFSRMQIMGIFIPYTGEALLNPRIPASQLAHTAAHEAAHQRGFAREAEADFVGYLACVASGDPGMAYSGTLTMLRYAALSLGEADPEAYDALAARFSPGIVADYNQQLAYWQAYDTPLAGFANLTNERYLRTFALSSRRQELRGDVVALLLANFESGRGK